MKKDANRFIATYRYNDEYFIDVVTENLETRFRYEAWLYHKDYGVKDLMFGIEDPNDGHDGFVDLAEHSAEEYIKTYEYYHMKGV